MAVKKLHPHMKFKIHFKYLIWGVSNFLWLKNFVDTASRLFFIHMAAAA
jgi:hypothetical protein